MSLHGCHDKIDCSAVPSEIRWEMGYDYTENNAVLDLCVRRSYPFDYNSTSDISDVSHVENNQLQELHSKFKCSRPFKAYRMSPFHMGSLTMRANAASRDSDKAYSEFRDTQLARTKTNHNYVNKNMTRTRIISNNQHSDPCYLEKRLKNNAAAKRSRDARKIKEDEMAIRCAFLEQENIQLKFRLAVAEGEKHFQNITYY